MEVRERLLYCWLTRVDYQQTNDGYSLVIYTVSNGKRTVDQQLTETEDTN